MKLEKPKVYKKFFNAFPDERGFLTAFDLEKIQKKLDIEFNYQLVSLSKKKFTFRGFHYQKDPKAQNKIIAIHSGQIIDFAVDINFPSSLNIKNFELSAGDIIVIPKNYAHGFLSKTDDVVIQYFLDEKYSAKHYTGLNAKDFIKNKFPKKKIIISKKDKALKEEILIDN